MTALSTVLIAVAVAGATIQGTVRSAGTLEPIAHATIRAVELRRFATADAKGYFVLADVPDGTIRLEVSAPGYATNTVELASSGDGVIRLDFELEIRPLELDGVEIDAREGDAVTGAPTRAPPSAGPPAARIEGSTIKRMPALFEADVLRALQVLPAVSAISDFSSALYVRGGSADQNLITLDGFPLFNPYHVGGIFSAIGADAVSTVDVFAGAFPASAGDRLSSIVQIRTRDGARDATRASGAIGLLSAHITADGPLGSGGSFLFSGRRTYLDAMSGAAYGVGLIDYTLPYGFSDAYLKATHGIGAAGTVSLSGYLDLESVSMPARMRQEMNGNMLFDWGARMLALSYRQPLGGSLLLDARAGYSGFAGSFDGWEYRRGPCEEPPANPCAGRQIVDSTQIVRARTITRDLVAAADLTWYGRTHTVKTGVQIDGYVFDHDLETPGVNSELLSPFSYDASPATFAAYIEDRWSPSPTLELRAGVRLLDAGRYGRALMPRIGGRWQATSALALSVGAGRYGQTIRSLRSDESIASSFLAYDILAMQPDTIGLARSEDLVLGAEWSDERTRVRADAYVRRMRNLVLPPEPADPQSAPVLVTGDYRTGTGIARGIELSAAHNRGIASYALAYTLSSTRLTAGDDTFNPRYDRRHQLDASAVFEWPRTTLSARLAAGTGQPYTKPIGLFEYRGFDPVTQTWGPGWSVFERGPHNGDRLPGYLRLDVGVRRSYAKRWFGRDGTITPYLQVLNVLNTRNVLVSEPAAYERAELRYLPQLPFLPTFGLEWRF
jgi:hypothetical protein